MSKLFAVLLLSAVVLVALAGRPEKLRDGSSSEDSSDSSDSSIGITLERCDENFCGNIKQCHECCEHNFYLEYMEAEDNVELQHDAIDKMCSCLHKVNGHSHQ